MTGFNEEPAPQVAAAGQAVSKLQQRRDGALAAGRRCIAADSDGAAVGPNGYNLGGHAATQRAFGMGIGPYSRTSTSVVDTRRFLMIGINSRIITLY